MANVAAVIGSTGLVGGHILSNLLSLESSKTVHTISRRAPKSEGAKLNAVVEADSSKWAATLASITPKPDVVYSALGTTRAQAGGIANQWKIDHDLNVELAKQAKSSGIKTFVFISSAGTRGLIGGRAPYSQMKQGVEDTVKSLEFEQAIIVRPGLIMGPREQAHLGGPLLNTLARTFGGVHKSLQDFWAQEAEVIGRAAIHATQLAEQGKAPSKYWVLEQADIVRLGRDEWKA